MASVTIDNVVKGNIVMHDHSESDLGAILDTRYLKLDASNDPLTGDLNMSGAYGVYFRDGNSYVYSGGAGSLGLVATSQVLMTTPSVQIGRNVAEDLTLNFNSLNNDGTLTWNDVGNSFQFSDDVIVDGDLTISGDDLFMTTNTANYFLMADGTNYNPTTPANARTGLGLDSGGAGDIWVEKAGDTMTGGLKIDYNVPATATYLEVETGISTADSAVEITAFLADMQDNSTAGDTGHVKRGFEVYNIPKHNQIGGDWEDYGLFVDMRSLAEIPHGDYAVNYDIFGAKIISRDIGVSDGDGGSWDDVNVYGIYLQGWKGIGDDSSGLDNLNRWAIYSDGGDVELTDGDLTTTGTISATTIAGANTNWDAAYSHISSSGADHSYIDQDVTSGSSPTFDGTNFTGIDISTGTNLVAGDGMDLTDDTLSVDYNSTNLKITSTELNTIQDIDTTATPSFAGILATDKIKFTQTDGNEYIDSLADGYLDLAATTAIRLNSNVYIDSDTNGLYLGDSQDVFLYANDARLRIDANSTTSCLRLESTDADNDWADFFVDSSSNLFINPNGGVVWIGDGNDTDYALGFRGSTTEGSLTYHPATGRFTLSEPLTLTSGALLGTPVTGTLEFYGNKLYITNKSLQKVIDRTSDVKTTTTTVTNTTTETTVFTASVPANSWVAGNILKMYMYGEITNKATSKDVTINVKVGGDTVATIASTGGKLTNACWHVEGISIIRSVGASGEMAWHMDLAIEDEASCAGCNVSEIDTTGALDITVTAQWDSADDENIFICTGGFMEYKN